MSVDPEYLQEHYAFLSDEALSEIDRSELVDTARNCYDSEVRRRGLSERRDQGHERIYPVIDGGKPDWLEEASEVFMQDGRMGVIGAVDARDALEAAGIPCYLEASRVPVLEESVTDMTDELRVLVPGNLNQWATSVLERDIFNCKFEEVWRTHLEVLSDEELQLMNPQKVFCGLFDRVERVTKAYNEEISRREATT